MNESVKVKKMDIKEILELLEGIKDAGVLGVSVLADGKVNLKDLAPLTKFLTQAGDIAKAIEGITLVDDEIKDLDHAEIAQIGAKSLEMIKEIKLAYESHK